VRDDREKLLDILEAIEKIDRYSGIDKNTYERDELIQTWMVYNTQVIGEAASQLSEEFRSKHSDIPWRAISSMRNATVHAYFRVDLDAVWTVVRDDLPGLKRRIQRIVDVQSVKGMLADSKRSVDDFLREKREEIETDEIGRAHV
jgi:uncharacterized protein with HEPN domain